MCYIPPKISWKFPKVVVRYMYLVEEKSYHSLVPQPLRAAPAAAHWLCSLLILPLITHLGILFSFLLVRERRDIPFIRGP